MSVYNSEKYLAEAIESVLNQTYRNFEFIIVNDGSQDNSLDIIQKYQKKDNRIILIDRENKGLPYSLNEGISIARGEYIARMDADDICHPKRFKKQLEYMQMHNLDICGSFVDSFNNKGTYNKISYPTNDRDIKFTLLFHCCLAHPSVIIKRKVFDKIRYDVNYKQAQDYRLWIDAAKENFTFGNIPEALLQYRIHEEQVTISKSKNQQTFARKIRANYALRFGVDVAQLISKIDYISGNCNRKIFKSVLSDTVELAKSKKISKISLFSILRYLYNVANPKNPLLYFTYRHYTKNYQKDIKCEFTLLIKSLIKKESPIFKIAKKIRDFTIKLR